MPGQYKYVQNRNIYVYFTNVIILYIYLRAASLQNVRISKIYFIALGS